jgi:predicted  nucleic acid-binding Zn-ribbon protein
MSRPKSLYDLQQIDSQLDSYAVRLGEIEAELADDHAVQAAIAKAEAAEQDLQEAEKALRLAEQAVQDQDYKIKQSQNRLYSGSVTNPKELEDIQNEVEALKRYREVLEERLLEAMLVVDDAEERYDQAQDQLEHARAQRSQKEAKLKGEKAQIEKHAAQLEEQRKNQIAGISEADLETYKKIRLKRGGVAVAKVDNQGCSACGATLGTAAYQAARSPSQLTFCDTCGRILFTE